MFTDKINKKILDIWRNYCNNDDLSPVLYNDIKPSNILFLSLNPSFPKFSKGMRKDLGFESDSDLTDFYKWGNYDTTKSHIFKLEDKIAKESYPYFNKIKEIANELGYIDSWLHLDLFFYRETNQNEFLNKVYSNNYLNNFGERQFNLIYHNIHKIDPKVIVVPNAMASKILKNRFSIDRNEVREKGYNTVKINNKDIPIFFSGMFSGQRAMDIDSFNRPIYLIKKSIN